MLQNVFLQYLEWHFLEMPRNILKAWRNFLLFYLNYFSIPLLLKTLFSPWRRYAWAYPRGFDLAKYLEILFSNLVTRIIGAAIRVVFVMVGAAVEVIIFFAGLFIFIGWILLPVIIILSFSYGLKLLL